MNRLAVILPFIALLLAPACGGGSESASGGGGGSGASGTGGTGGAASGTGGANAGGIGGMTSGGTTSGGTAAGGASGSGATSGSSGSSGQGGSAGNGAGGNGGTGQGGASGAGSGGMPGGAGMGGAGQGGGAACGTVADTASPVPETQRTGSPPAPMGGTLTDGTYHLTAWDVYPPADTDSDMHSATLRISAGTFEVVVDGSSRQSGSVSSAGVVLTFTPSCPAASPASKPYSASATTLALVTVAENRVEVLTKQ